MLDAKEKLKIRCFTINAKVVLLIFHPRLKTNQELISFLFRIDMINISSSFHEALL